MPNNAKITEIQEKVVYTLIPIITGHNQEGLHRAKNLYELEVSNTSEIDIMMITIYEKGLQYLQGNQH